MFFKFHSFYSSYGPQWCYGVKTRRGRHIASVAKWVWKKQKKQMVRCIRIELLGKRFFFKSFVSQF